MQTFFAPPERLNNKDILKQVQSIKDNIFLTKMLNSLKSLIAVINFQRQIIAVNEELIKALGFDSVEEIFGMRPGEAINCVYAKENKAGCGTSKMCRSCGAVKAILNSIEYNATQVELCAMRIKKNDQTLDVAFEVTACPISINQENFITLHMRDITNERLKNAMERTFFHDINNVLSALIGTSEMLTMDEDKNTPLEKRVNSLSLRVAKEIEVQRALTYAHDGSYLPEFSEMTVKDIMDNIMDYCESDNLSIESKIKPEELINTDHTLLLRILTNMVKNGLEASNKNENVILTVYKADNKNTFSVWNSKVIPEDIHRRIFQEHFSTKNGNYRGLGTHSMKTFGEKILKGKIWFESKTGKGTTFFFQLP